MSFVAAVATGRAAVDDLLQVLRAPIAPPGAVWVAHRDHLVAWDSRNTWVDSHDDGDVLVVLDGQLHSPTSRNHRPAELIHGRYLERGPDAARGLLGDFVLVVLDRGRNSLTVSRDPLGVRPWYQARVGQRGAGATDLATLCRLPWVDREVDDVQALAFLAGFSRSAGPTLYRGIHTLRPGTTWHMEGGEARCWEHHEWRLQPEFGLQWEEAAERCRELLGEAVVSRVTAAGAATSELSGGLDSSAVVGTAMRLELPDVLVGRLLFEGPHTDERRFSDLVIRYWGIEEVSVSPRPLSEEELQAWTLSLCRPVPDANFSMFETLYRSFLARGRRAGLTGLGGDDAFALGPRRTRILSAARRRDIRTLARLAAEDARHPRSAWRSTWRGVVGHYVPHRRRIALPAHLMPPEGTVRQLQDWLTARPAPVTGDPAVDDRASGLTAGYVASILEESALVLDGAGWRSSHPMLDPRFIAGTYGLDPWFPVHDGADRALASAAFADRLPAEVRVRRDKAEFSEVFWTGELDRQVWTARLASGPLVRRGWIDPHKIPALVADAESGAAYESVSFGRATALDRWLRTLGE